MTRVVDGDTVDVDLDGVTRRVRYIGMDTPEVYGGVEPFGREASAFNSEIVMGKHVCLEKDVSEVDRYQRLLRYIWLPDGRMVNEELLLAGLATVSTYPPDVKYTQPRFLAAQKKARDEGRGMWAP